MVAGVHTINNLQNNLIINPNPSNGTFILQLTKPFAKESTVEIFNAVGNCVYKKLITENTSRISFDGTDLAAGLYLCRMVSMDRVEQVSFVRE